MGDATIMHSDLCTLGMCVRCTHTYLLFSSFQHSYVQIHAQIKCMYVYIHVHVVNTPTLEKDKAKIYKSNPKAITPQLLPWMGFESMTFSILR